MNISKSTFRRTACAFALLAATTISAQADSRVYIPMGSDNTIVIVEKDNGKITGQISGLPSVHGLAGTPDGKFLIAGSYEDRKPGEEMPAKPAAVSGKDHLKHHPGKKKNSATEKPAVAISTVSIIRTSDNSIVRRIDVPGAVHHVSVSPNGKFAVVTLADAGRISAIDLETFEVAATLATGEFSNYAVFSPDSSKLYISNAGNDTVSIVNTKRWTVERNIITGKGPEHATLSSDGKMLFVNNVEDGTVSFISVNDATTVKTIPVGQEPHGLDISDDDKTLFVAVKGSDALVSINVESGETKKVALAPTPYHLTNIRGSGELYVSSAEAPDVWIIDKKSLTPVRKIPVGGKAHQMVLIDGS